MSADGDLREYAPTARRLARLRQAGIFPRSQVLTAAGVLGAVLLIAAGFSGLIMGVLSRSLAGLLKSSFEDPVAALKAPPLIEAGLVAVAALVAIWLVAVGIGTLQRWAAPGGDGSVGVFSERSKVSYARGRAADLAWELVVSAVILAGGGLIIYGLLPLLLDIPTHQPQLLAHHLQQIVWAFAWRFGLLMAGLGLCDYLYQRAIFWRGAAMTRQELQQEIRETEGSWLVRWWRQRRMRDR